MTSNSLRLNDRKYIRSFSRQNSHSLGSRLLIKLRGRKEVCRGRILFSSFIGNRCLYDRNLFSDLDKTSREYSVILSGGPPSPHYMQGSLTRILPGRSYTLPVDQVERLILRAVYPSLTNIYICMWYVKGSFMYISCRLTYKTSVCLCVYITGIQVC